jgi:hypothetical protein
MIRRLSAFAFSLLLATSAAALDVSTCGVTIPTGEVGVLQNDLSCAGAFVVALERSATLELNGHTLSLATPGASWPAVVRCESRRCAVGGPGTIECAGPGRYSSGIGMPEGGRLDVADVLIQGCDQGIWDTGNPGARTRVYATDVTVLDCTYNGIEAEKVLATNVEASHNGYSGLAVEQVKGTTIVVDGNGALPNLHSGITSFNGTVKVTGLVATNNAKAGVEAKKVVLTSSTVIDNDLLDIASRRRPRLVDVVCGTSAWGVCQDD